MAIVTSEKRLYDIDPKTGIEFLAAPAGYELEESEYKRLLAYNKRRGAVKPEAAMPPMDEVRARARELGIEFKGNTGKIALLDLIAAKEAETAPDPDAGAQPGPAGETAPDPGEQKTD